MNTSATSSQPPVTDALDGPTEFCRLIRANRIARGLSIASLAEAASSSRQMVSMVEKGQRRPDDALAIRLARVLEIDPRRAAILAMRDRLPPELRDLTPADGDFSTREAARLHGLACFDYEVPVLSVSMTANRMGDVRIVRRFEGLRPIPGGSPLQVLKFAEKAAPGQPQVPKLRPISEPDHLTCHTHSYTSRDGAYHRHRIDFPGGWSQPPGDDSDGLTFEIEINRKRAFSTDDSAGLGAFTHLVTHPAWRLRLTMEFAPGTMPPARWLEPAAWLGSGEYEEDRPNVIERLCRSWSISRTERRATLEIEEPLIQVTFAIPWLMGGDRDREGI